MDVLQKLILSLQTIQGIGEKSAKRIAYQLLTSGESKTEACKILEALDAAIKYVCFCDACNGLTSTDHKVCTICSDHARTNSLCVVSRMEDLHSIESLGVYKGYYFVTHGCLSPIEGLTPSKLKLSKISEFLTIHKTMVKEVILALPTSHEGVATAHYIKSSLPSDVRVKGLKHGMPFNGDISTLNHKTLIYLLNQTEEIN